MYFVLNELNWQWELVSDDAGQREARRPGIHQVVSREGDVYLSRPRVYPIAFIGVGSSTAYYLETLGPPFYMPSHVTWTAEQRGLPPKSKVGIRKLEPGIVIGMVDEWDARVRGDGDINHEEHQIAHWGTQVPQFSRNYMSRAAFAQSNREILEAARVERLEAQVTCVAPLNGPGTLFGIDTTTTRRAVLALKVVVAMGAGPHRRSGDLHVDARAEDRVMNLDQFMRAHPAGGRLGEGKPIVVHGPNAGIDAVERAAEHGYRVIWFVGRTDPVLLPGNRLRHAPRIARSDDLIKVDRRVDVSPGASGAISITYKVDGAPANSTLNASLYVYALGQNPDADGAVGDVLSRGGIVQEKLEPIYDRNQIFGKPYETVLGLQWKGTTFTSGLEVVGAAASSLLQNWRIQHNFGTQFALATYFSSARGMEHTQAYQAQNALLEEGRQLHAQPRSTPFELFNRVVRQDVASVVLTAQLVGVKASIAAINAMIPPYVLNGSGTNLTTDNRTMLRVYMALRYPNISEEDAEYLIDAILRYRRSEGHPLGYDDWWINHFVECMEWWNRFRQER